MPISRDTEVTSGSPVNLVVYL